MKIKPLKSTNDDSPDLVTEQDNSPKYVSDLVEDSNVPEPENLATPNIEKQEISGDEIPNSLENHDLPTPEVPHKNEDVIRGEDIDGFVEEVKGEPGLITKVKNWYANVPQHKKMPFMIGIVAGVILIVGIVAIIFSSLLGVEEREQEQAIKSKEERVEIIRNSINKALDDYSVDEFKKFKDKVDTQYELLKDDTDEISDLIDGFVMPSSAPLINTADELDPEITLEPTEEVQDEE